MKNISSLKSLSDKALNAQLAATKKLEKQLLTELDNRLYARQQVLKAKVKNLEGLDRKVALFKPITAKRAMETIRSVRSLLAADMAKVPNLKFYHLLSLDSTQEIRRDFYTKVPKIFAKDPRGNVYEYVEFNRNGKLQFLGRVKA
jgi:hypothetical protein